MGQGKSKGRGAPRIDIGIGAADRKAIADGLGRVLADTYMLYLKTHAFHWNVEGPMFNTLHAMFMEQYTELWNAVDLVAERIRALGFPAPGTAEARARFESTLRAHQPQPTPALAAPGLSPHGRMHAVDFQVRQGALTVAGPSTAQVPAVWVGQGWRDRLEYAVRRASDKFRGPLQNPDEPWHYDYHPSL